jgi:hypothetical protein
MKVVYWSRRTNYTSRMRSHSEHQGRDGWIYPVDFQAGIICMIRLNYQHYLAIAHLGHQVRAGRGGPPLILW